MHIPKRCARNNFVSSSKPRVDTSRLPNTSSSLPSSSSSSSSVQLSKETHRLLGVTDRRYKSQLFERPGKTKDQTSLNAAKIELQGKQIDLAIERGIKFDHVSKVEASQVSSSKPRVDTSKLPNTNHATLSASSSSSSSQLSKETQKLLGVTDRSYKQQFFERAGKSKEQTSLRAAQIELTGEQIPLAVERGRSYDHITKVTEAQEGLLGHIEKVKFRLSHPKLPINERPLLEQELSNASTLLDYSEVFVPRVKDSVMLQQESISSLTKPVPRV